MSSHENAPQPRPEPDGDDTDDESGRGRSRIDRLTANAGPRRTANVEMLVIEAEQAHAGGDPGNYATPITEEVGEELFDRLENHEIDDIRPAWFYQDRHTSRESER